MASKSLERARFLVARYNRQTAQLDALESRLARLRERREDTRSAAFKALPDGFGIIMGDPFEVSEPHCICEHLERGDHGWNGPCPLHPAGSVQLAAVREP